MLKMKEPPGMCMKTKDRTTICPTQKTTFVPGCTSFYTKIHVFCRIRRLFCKNLNAGERTGHFKMSNREELNRVRLGLPPASPWTHRRTQAFPPTYLQVSDCSIPAEQTRKDLWRSGNVNENTAG